MPSADHEGDLRKAWFPLVELKSLTPQSVKRVGARGTANHGSQEPRSQCKAGFSGSGLREVVPCSLLNVGLGAGPDDKATVHAERFRVSRMRASTTSQESPPVSSARSERTSRCQAGTRLSSTTASASSSSISPGCDPTSRARASASSGAKGSPRSTRSAARRRAAA